MPTEFTAFGEPLPGLTPESLTTQLARRTLTACVAHPDFEVLELRRLVADTSSADVIVVDCLNDRVPSRNRVGIKNRERLALVFWLNSATTPEVRALRKDFPTTIHQNQVGAGEPASLCLYFEPWSAIERTWTPQKHLHRVLWWLEHAAKGTLHSDDQPVERLYFDSPIDFILPPDFDEKHRNAELILVSRLAGGEPERHRAIACDFKPKLEAARAGLLGFVPIVLSLPPIVHGLERFPNTLGACRRTQ